MQQSMDLLVSASNLPLSVIIIGVGDSDFSKMEILDGDSGIVDSRGTKASRDICQFVPFNRYKGDPTQLAEKVLSELPGQVVKYKALMGHPPRPPMKFDMNSSVLNFA
eukprot:TRINITY_DN10004_c0_g1_i3.p1 TRINITY_DN10004_c0_g1~~TRINITY_DN10004_c0_g1_i3.p1  ORF type:complete len:108 (+),score=18.69 TRINITY_DN10004_c0_g1_i3:199-522(+)